MLAPLVTLADDEMLVEWFDDGPAAKIILSFEDGAFSYAILNGGSYRPGLYKDWPNAVAEIRSELKRIK